MLPRNIIELIILLLIISVGLVVFLIIKRKADSYESVLHIRKKKDIPGRF